MAQSGHDVGKSRGTYSRSNSRIGTPVTTTDEPLHERDQHIRHGWKFNHSITANARRLLDMPLMSSRALINSLSIPPRTRTSLPQMPANFIARQ